MTGFAELAQADIGEAPVIESEGFLLSAPFNVDLCHFCGLFGGGGGGLKVGGGGLSNKRW